jgi:DNA-binding transcriptional ArsR family regulator
MSLDRPDQVFAALGDPTRLALVSRLCEGGPLSITRLAEGRSVSRQAVTKHLEILEEAGLVRGSRVGRERVWELAPDRLIEARQWIDRASARWDAVIDRLRRMVEDEPG